MNKKSQPAAYLQTMTALVEQNLINRDELPAFLNLENKYSTSITNQMRALINNQDAQDPIAKQFIPQLAEEKNYPNELSDAIGDEKHQKVKGIVHRYPDRCLLTPLHICPVYCRFCFRKNKVGQSDLTLTPSELQAAYAYIKTHTEIWEVIITGGDPLILKPKLLSAMISALSAIEHVEIIRIHSRVPMVDSKRIDVTLLNALATKKALYIAIHANHPREFTPAAIAACHALQQAGVVLISQTTLLKNINDNIETLGALMRLFVKHKIKPYYLHHADLVPGTKHFRTSIHAGQALLKALRGRFSGLCQPTYVLDIPGGYGKVPIGPQYLGEHVDSYLVEDYLGKKHTYIKE